MKRRFVGGAVVGAIIAVLLWGVEWGIIAGGEFAWARTREFMPLFFGLTAYGFALYLLGGSLVGGVVGALLPGTGGGRFNRLLVVALIGLPALAHLLLLINRHCLPEIRSIASILGNVGLVVAAVVALLALGALLGRATATAPGARRAAVTLASGWAAALLLCAAAAVYWKASQPGIPHAAAAEQRKPNVLLFLLETTRADHVGCYGYHRNTTPNTDQLAAEGVVFENYYTVAPFSGPSKASLATGTFPHNNGVRSMPQRIRTDTPTLAQVFRGDGYRTAGFASGHFMGPQYDYHRGFTTYECLGTPYDLLRFGTALRGLPLALHRITPWYLGDDERLHAVDATRGVGRVLDWIDDGGAAPFFCLLELNEPHSDYVPPPPFDTLFTEDYPEYDLMKKITDKAIPRYDLVYAFDKLGYTQRDVDQTVALYDGEIAYADHAIGRVVDGLRARGLLDNTIVVVTADHGEAFGEHGVWFEHTQLYEACLRVPLVMRYPRKIEPRRVKSLVQEVDVFPTLLALAGVAYDGPLDGVSMLRKFENDVSDYPVFAEDNIIRDSLLLAYPNYRMYLPGVAGKWRMVREGDWKLIYIPNPRGDEFELYNIASDPLERDNRFAVETEVADRLMLLLDQFIAADKYGDSSLDPAMLKEREKELRSLGYLQ